MNIIGKKIIEFDLVELESINDNSNYNSFVNNEETSTPKDVFGKIIVCKDLLGRTREIISGKYIPIIKTSFDPEMDFYPITEIPSSPYRGKLIDSGYVDETTIDEYIKENSNDEFVQNLDNFINTAKLCKKRNSLVRRLIKK